MYDALFTETVNLKVYLAIYLKILFNLGSRYLIIGFSLLFIFNYLFKNYFKNKKIQQKYPSIKDALNEVKNSLISFLFMSLVISSVILLKQFGYTKIYGDISEYGYGYFAFSVIILIFFHDTYFYWMHRTIHHPKLFNLFHKVHHESHNPTSLATFSFHPLEAILEASNILLICFILPLHPTAIAIFSLWSFFFNVFGHLGYEFYPSGFTTHPIFKWLNTATHHNLHHQKSNSNYSIYFNFWDRIMNTNNEKYHEYFESVKERDNNSIIIKSNNALLDKD